MNADTRGRGRTIVGAGESNGERYRWAGPALFIAVALALLVFFWWFLSAG
ncbi:MAG: hypothetical protein GWO39_04785 [Gammaproteobacteria bacterium]|nr:hypothetical protein [Gammaproteobacteria bacterium]NIX10181.1 hypothetical protein [Gammaproteobacteria bacterium]NIY31699.1 hypothetical protein [Gammaproteobacteria bacterium]